MCEAENLHFSIVLEKIATQNAPQAVLAGRFAEGDYPSLPTFLNGEWKSSDVEPNSHAVQNVRRVGCRGRAS